MGQQGGLSSPWPPHKGLGCIALGCGELGATGGRAGAVLKDTTGPQPGLCAPWAVVQLGCGAAELNGWGGVWDLTFPILWISVSPTTLSQTLFLSPMSQLPQRPHFILQPGFLMLCGLHLAHRPLPCLPRGCISQAPSLRGPAPAVPATTCLGVRAGA